MSTLYITTAVMHSDSSSSHAGIDDRLDKLYHVVEHRDVINAEMAS